MTEREFKYPSTPESVGLMLDDVTSVLKQERVGHQLMRRALLAISEAFTNALVHGNQLQAHRLVRIRLAVNETDIAADISDNGKGGLRRIRDKRPATPEAEGGRGIDLIRHFASSTEFTEAPDGGLRVILKFSRMKESTLSNI
jgi:anti-sigma regulatory factor (Ser/Thr protein kinase)